jgi:transcriptional regulator with XRE-family HTH domain
MALQEIFGRNVRRERVARQLTIEALAQEAGLSYSYVGEIERGLRNPTLSAIERLAATLNVPPDELLRP